MSVLLKPNTVNEISKGTVLFEQNEKTTYICLIARGRVLAESKGLRAEIMQGQMICVFDAFFSQSNLCTYTALEDCVLYAVPASSEENVCAFLTSNPEYRGVVYGSLCKQLATFYASYKEMSKFSMDGYEHLLQHYEQLYRKGKKDAIPREFLERKPSEEIELETEEDEIEFYVECSKLSFDVQGKYFNASESMVEFQVRRVANVIRSIIYCCENLCDYVEEMQWYFINGSETGLYNQEVQFALEMKRKGVISATEVKALKDTRDTLLGGFAFISKKYKLNLAIDKEFVDELFNKVLDDADNTGASDHTDEDLSVLDYSLKQILDYSELQTGQRETFVQLIEQFVELPDRLSTDDSVRSLRKSITKCYYEVFENCAYKALTDRHTPKPVVLFLNYGFLDERLLSRDQLSELLSIREEETKEPIRVFTILEWLRAIYDGQKQPSRNEFEQGYPEYLRDQKKNGYISEQEEKQLLEDKKERFKFEIHNMIRYNTKVVNGKISSYVPFIYQEQYFGDLKKAFISKKEIIETVEKIEEKDFSIFRHNTLFSKPEQRIDREYIQKLVYPDIVIMPIYGSSSSMWQEIETRKRDSPGRFLLPAFCEEDFDTIIIKTFGRFHWEYCRCEMGANWNNIQYPSLTAEYSDYIQYYRKNHSLSEERRERIKLQITKAKNNLREIFVQDYTEWIKNESMGAMKLNKVSRAILATYCPMNKSYRQIMDKNSAMTEAMAKYRRELGKTIKDYELHLRYLEKNGIERPKEMDETYAYYLEQVEE